MTTPFLTDADVADLRGLAEDAMPHRCDLGRVALTHRPGGWREGTFDPTRQNVRCVCTPATRASGTRTARRDQLVPPPGAWRLALPARTPMDGVTRVLVTGTDAAGEAFTRALAVVRVERPTVEAVRVVWCDDATDLTAGEG